MEQDRQAEATREAMFWSVPENKAEFDAAVQEAISAPGDLQAHARLSHILAASKADGVQRSA